MILVMDTPDLFEGDGERPSFAARRRANAANAETVKGHKKTEYGVKALYYNMKVAANGEGNFKNLGRIDDETLDFFSSMLTHGASGKPALRFDQHSYFLEVRGPLREMEENKNAERGLARTVADAYNEAKIKGKSVADQLDAMGRAATNWGQVKRLGERFFDKYEDSRR